MCFHELTNMPKYMFPPTTQLQNWVKSFTPANYNLICYSVILAQYSAEPDNYVPINKYMQKPEITVYLCTGLSLLNLFTGCQLINMSCLLQWYFQRNYQI